MTDQDISEIKEEYSKFSYQWIKGDNLSQTQHFEDLIEEGGRKYILFTDKTRISLDLLDEYMIKVEKGFEEIIPIANQNPLEQPAPEVNSNRGVKTREVQEIRPQVRDDNPIFALLSKQKENWVDVDLKLSINLPPRSLWDVLMGSFDEAEKDILEYVTKDLDIEVVRQSLRESIKDIYKKQKTITSTKNVRSQDSISE